MAEKSSLSNPLVWEGNYWNRVPVWPREPDVAIIKTIVKEHLAPRLPAPLNDSLLDVTFFAEGAYNRLYLVSYTGERAAYMFRATLPVIPFFKTESEVATLAWLRLKTSIPVPRVYAWDSSAKNDLGFEWIMMEKVAGVELRNVWRQIPWERKLELIDEIAVYKQQLRRNTFDSVGALYFESALARPRNGRGEIIAKVEGPDTPDRRTKNQPAILTKTTKSMPQTPTLISFTELSHQERPKSCDGTQADHKFNSAFSRKFEGEGFTIGPVFDRTFWFGCRLYLPGNRGPYQSCSEWLKARIDMQETLSKNGRPEDDPDYDKDLESEAPGMIDSCQRYREILPELFPGDEDKVTSILHAHDLNEANILVHPKTFRIQGIVDWETTNFLPIWAANDCPVFINDNAPFDDEEPPIPAYEDTDDGGPIDHAIEARDRWDYQLLRNRFEETTQRLSGDTSDLDRIQCAHTKRELEQSILSIVDFPIAAERWLRKYRAGEDESGDEADSVEQEVSPDEEDNEWEAQAEAAQDQVKDLEGGFAIDTAPQKTLQTSESNAEAHPEKQLNSELAAVAQTAEQPSQRRETGKSSFAETAARTVSNWLRRAANFLARGR